MSRSAHRRSFHPGVLPGFGPTLGVTLTWLSLLVLLPMAALALHAAQLDAAAFVGAIGGPRALAAYRLSFGGAFLAALVNALAGLVVAWTLTRYDFPGKALVDALVDLPLALPTAVAGISLSALWAENGWLGGLVAPLGLRVAYTPLGVLVAMVFVGLPFVVRTVQPVLQEIDPQLEEASALLGATRLQTLLRVVLPALFPSLLTGFALAFARGVGEYGSIVFLSGNMPLRTEIVPLLIVTKLEQYDTAGATALAVVMLGGSFVLLGLVNGLQAWSRRGRRG